MAGEFTPSTVALIIARDRGACARCGRDVTHLERGRAWSIHHRRPRGQGGTSLAWVAGAANGLVLCGSGTTGCHGAVEADREAAYKEGFLVRINGRDVAADVAIRHKTLGLVYLDDDGGYAPAEEGPTPESMWKDVA